MLSRRSGLNEEQSLEGMQVTHELLRLILVGASMKSGPWRECKPSRSVCFWHKSISPQ